MLSVFWGEWRAAEHKFLFRAEGTMPGGGGGMGVCQGVGACGGMQALARIREKEGWRTESVRRPAGQEREEVHAS